MVEVDGLFSCGLIVVSTGSTSDADQNGGSSAGPPTPGAPHGSLGGDPAARPAGPGRAVATLAAAPAGGLAAGVAALRSRLGPRVVLGGTAAAAAGVAPAAARAGGAGDLGGGVLQRRADLLDLDLEDGALLALAGLVRRGLRRPCTTTRMPRCSDSATFSAACRQTEQERNRPSPSFHSLVCLSKCARRRGDPEVGHGRTRRGEAQLRVVDEVADHGDDGLACHVRSP